MAAIDKIIAVLEAIVLLDRRSIRQVRGKPSVVQSSAQLIPIVRRPDGNRAERNALTIS